MININVVRRKLIKPCTPTPQNLNKYKLSFIDELIRPMEVGVLLFHPTKPKRISQLEESLAKILVQFYPLAGRYMKKDRYVDCSDQGIEFVQAQAIDVELVDVVEKTTTLEQLNGFHPRKNYQADEAWTDPLLSIQATELKCGGLVIGVSVSHKIFDASSLGTFIAAWSSASNPGRGGEITPRSFLDSSSFFPGKNQNDIDVEPSANGTHPPRRTVVKRFSFEKEAITTLKLMSKDGERSISRVRVVCAVIAKALIGVERAKYGEESRRFLMAQMVNMRERTIPPVSKHACGNLAILSLTPFMTATEAKDMGIQELVCVLGDAIDKSMADCAEILSPTTDDALNNIIVNPTANAFAKSASGEANVIWFSDWSKFGFYAADFGWGKPVWASIVPLPGEDMIVLMDNKEGSGIEAWVHLNPMDMSYFEQDEDIRLFATYDLE